MPTRAPFGCGGRLLPILLCCLACARPAPEAPEGVAPELEALYLMVHDYRMEYETGIDLIVSGDVVTGESVLAAATDRIRAAAELCATLPDCRPALFTDTLEGAVRHRRIDMEFAEAEEPTDLADEADEADEADDDSIATRIPEVERTITLLAEAKLQDLIPFNAQVKSELNDWLTWNRPTLIQAYENYLFLQSEIAPIYREAGLPEALLFATIATEAEGKVHAYSRRGAAGPLQFMPHTGLRYGLGSIDGFDMRLDPVAATRANVAYLSDQLAALNNDLEKTLAAYNVGETRVRRMNRKHRDLSYWDAQFYYSLPAETRDYVPRIFAAALIFLEPQRYGVEFPTFQTQISTVVLAEARSLGELTICLGQHGNPEGWFRTLRNLNPRLRPADIYEAGTSIRMPSMLVTTFAERCVGGSEMMRLARELHIANYPEQPELVPYVVRRGDTLAEIATRHRCWSVGQLATINEVRAPEYVIHVGQRLSVPACG